ncbi:MAG: uroporphyrinogen-III synthase [Reyranella sp.]|nr:MAG: uroporphyrinogen-III synthase [Reyranella sp.]
MRVLITRPEREATTLAAALAERGHVPVIAPLFRLEILRPPADFAATLAASQAVLLTSANGARALAEASDQRGRPILAVGDTTASTAEGLGFSSVQSAAGDGVALAELARRQLDPASGPLLHVSGADVAVDLVEALKPDGFEVKRFALYDAREETELPDSARAALQARALDAATFFSPRAAEHFARLIQEAGLSGALAEVTAIAISPAALQPLSALPFKATVAAARPTRQSVLDEIDRLATAGVEGPSIMSDTPSSPDTPPPPAPPAQVRRGIGVIGAFITGVIASSLVLAGALISLPYWPADIRALWRGEAAAPPPPAPALDLQAVRADASAVANAAVDAARRDLTAKLDDLERRVRAVSATAAERPAATPDPAIAELRGKIAALENRPAGTAPTSPAPAAGTPAPDQEKELAALKLEIATLRNALQTLDQSMVTQRDQAKVLAEAVDKARTEAGARGAGEQKALAAARASAVIGVAARLNVAVESGLPFTTELGLLAPLAQGDAKLTEVVAALQPHAQTGVASRAVLIADFPSVAKAALADDLADDSFGERLLGKLRGLVSLRRVGGDVQGDSVEAKLARAEAALEASDLAKAVEIVKTLPPQTARATTGWLTRAEAHLAAKRAVDQLAAQAVALLGAAR